MIQEGGEGVILQSPDSPYLHGRSSFLIKLKVLENFLIIVSLIVEYKASRGDKEALVVSVADDNSLTLRL